MPPTIVYCDDKEKFLKQFEERHGREFRTEFVADIRELPGRLAARKLPPDLLLLDLYHPKRPADPEVLSRAEAAIASLAAHMREVKPLVEAAYEPAGIAALEAVRRRWKQLPVLMFSQQGLLMLDDEAVRRVDELGAEWLWKAQHSAETEAARIRNYIRRAAWNWKRETAIAVLFAVIGAMLARLI